MVHNLQLFSFFDCELRTLLRSHTQNCLRIVTTTTLNMILRIFFVSATLSNAALGYEDIVNIGQHLRATKNRHLTSCSSYPINFPVTTQTTVQWNGGGGLDKEWINVKNWQYQYLPGAHKFNRVVMAGLRTQATVHCPATYMQADVDVEIRTKATLDIHSG